MNSNNYDGVETVEGTEPFYNPQEEIEGAVEELDHEDSVQPHGQIVVVYDEDGEETVYGTPANVSAQDVADHVGGEDAESIDVNGNSEQHVDRLIGTKTNSWNAVKGKLQANQGQSTPAVRERKPIKRIE